MLRKHFDEARSESIKALDSLIQRESSFEKAVLIDDLFGQIRVAAWIGDRDHEEETKAAIDRDLKLAAGPFWTGEIWLGGVEDGLPDVAWEEGAPVTENLRVADRHRRLGSWLADLGQPPWPCDDPGIANPPIVVFYSFKGGMGRSTALASFAVRRARRGERVVVVDMDLDAPGVASLLAADDQGTMAQWGVVDYLLERPIDRVDLADYFHAYRRPAVTDPGEILVFPAGTLNDDYLGKLGRLDFESARTSGAFPLDGFLNEVRIELKPNWILLDSRTGLSEPAGILLGGVAHLHVLIGNTSEQSWRGLRLVLDRLGKNRVLQSKPQLDCILVQGMVPDNANASQAAIQAFAERARDEFTEHYYAESEMLRKQYEHSAEHLESLDELAELQSSLDEDIDGATGESPMDLDEDLGFGDHSWDLGDLDSSDSPHVSLPLSYKSKLAHFSRLEDVIHTLLDDEFRALETRILERFGIPEEQER